eukprot:2861726-Pleurochrysis_carterae.AAC.1
MSRRCGRIEHARRLHFHADEKEKGGRNVNATNEAATQSTVQDAADRRVQACAREHTLVWIGVRYVAERSPVTARFAVHRALGFGAAAACSHLVENQHTILDVEVAIHPTVERLKALRGGMTTPRK